VRFPVQITAQGLELTETDQDVIRSAAEKLEQFFARLVGCRVSVSVPNRFTQAEPIAHNVRIDLTVPGDELVIKRQPQVKLLDAIQDAFMVAGRRLKEYASRLPGAAAPPSRTAPRRARVVRLMLWEGYGFLEANDGHEIYFHRNSVRNGAFERLEIGDQVRFAEEEGDEGPQASTVDVARRRGIRRRSSI
jgi:cold shock CspA family protein/ribosome-associated translation inhibitor RaiA